MTPPSSPRRVHNGFVSARLPLFKKSGFVKGCKKGDPCSSRGPKTSDLCLQLCSQSILHRTRRLDRIRHRTRRLDRTAALQALRRTAPEPPSPRPAPPPRPLAPGVSMPPHTPCSLSSVFWASPRHALSARIDDTHHPAHSSLARTTALPRDAYAVATYPHRALPIYAPNPRGSAARPETHQPVICSRVWA